MVLIKILDKWSIYQTGGGFGDNGVTAVHMHTEEFVVLYKRMSLEEAHHHAQIVTLNQIHEAKESGQPLTRNIQ